MSGLDNDIKNHEWAKFLSKRIQYVQLANCQIAMISLAPASVAGGASREGTSWWWNQAAPGKTQAIMAGMIVEIGSRYYRSKARHKVECQVLGSRFVMCRRLENQWETTASHE